MFKGWLLDDFLAVHDVDAVPQAVQGFGGFHAAFHLHAAEGVHVHGLAGGLALYAVNGENPRYGDELMQAGLVTTDSTSGRSGQPEPAQGDFSCRLFYLEAE